MKQTGGAGFGFNIRGGMYTIALYIAGDHPQPYYT